MTLSTAEACSCAHCGATVSGPAARLDDDGRAFCCAGCETVAALIREGGWDAFYDRRSGDSPRPIRQATRRFDLASFADAHVRKVDGGACEATLRIGGIRCAACVWLNERAVASIDGVEDVRVSYGTGLATVRWRPEAVPLSAIADRIATLGYEAQPVDERSRDDRDLLLRLGVATFCATNVMLIQAAVYLGDFSGDMQERYARLFAWAALLLATPAVFYGGAPFFDRAWAGLRHRMVSMDVPIALAIVVMYAHALFAMRSGTEPYLDSLTMLIALLLAGQVAVSRGRVSAAEAAERVLAGAPDTAWRRQGEEVVEVGASSVLEGDTLVAGGGSILIADGEVTAGSAWLDRSHVTGESEPVHTRVGDSVRAGSRVVDGQLDLLVTAAPSRSTLAQVSSLVRQALGARTPATDLAQQIAPWFTIAVVGVAAIVGGVWTLVAGTEVALPIVVSVLVVACPCALALATPAAVAAGIGAAARHGAFVRDGEALARLAEVDIVAFDKTGTLTFGRPRITEASDEALQWAAPLEVGSSHPVARAIMEALERR
jgi:cation transport ATPase